MELKGIQLLILCLAVCIFNGDAKAAKKIRNGEDAREDEFPYQVYLEMGPYEWEHKRVVSSCGGSIIAKDWILTAAHCVYNKNKRLYELADINVYAGHTDLRKNPIANAVSKIIAHGGYDPVEYPKTTYFGDIALLKLTKPLKLDSHRRIIRLPKQSSHYPLAGTQGVVTGWGALFYNSSDKVMDLQKSDITIMSMAECRRYNGDAITAANVCARGTVENSGFCNGDSGGPLVVDNIIIGIVSTSVRCAEKYGDIYTNVAFFADWILSYIGSQKS